MAAKKKPLDPSRTTSPRKPAAKAAGPAAKKPAMPKWLPAPDSLARRFAELIKAIPEADTRKMFGYPAAFVAGRLFASLHQGDLILRLDDGDRARMLAMPGARVFEPMAGRPMKEYVVVPPALVESGEIAGWLARAFAYTETLPAKPLRTKKAKK